MRAVIAASSARVSDFDGKNVPSLYPSTMPAAASASTLSSSVSVNEISTVSGRVRPIAFAAICATSARLIGTSRSVISLNRVTKPCSIAKSRYPRAQWDAARSGSG